jgi:hypothetical protein
MTAIHAGESCCRHPPLLSPSCLYTKCVLERTGMLKMESGCCIVVVHHNKLKRKLTRNLLSLIRFSQEQKRFKFLKEVYLLQAHEA